MAEPSQKLLDTLHAIVADGGSCFRGELRDYVPGRSILLPLIREGMGLGVLETHFDMWRVTEAGRAAIAKAEGRSAQ